MMLCAVLAWALAACSSADGVAGIPRSALQLTAAEIVTVPGRTGTTRVVVADADSSASYTFDIQAKAAHGTSGVDAGGTVWFLPVEGFVGRDSLVVVVASSDPTVDATALVVSAVVDPLGLTGAGLRVYSSPYSTVDWTQTLRLKVQLHDHLGTNPTRLLAYDRAGYHVISTMNYSGMRAFAYALGEVRWPVENWLPSTFLDSLQSVRFFIPNAEQVGYIHATSPFLATYIERWDDSVTPTPTRQPWHYASEQEELSLIGQYGGFPIVAHPWYGLGALDQLRDFSGVEIYSAFARYRREEGTDPYYTGTDRNQVLLEVWDRLLLGNQRMLGVAVNDHFGPDNTSVTLSPRTRDSGKILALVPDATPGALRAAMEEGAVLALMDVGAVKDQLPGIDSITVGATSLAIHTGGQVSWIANGRPLIDAAALNFARLPAGTTYVRAEIRNAEGSTVFTQAFPVRLVGDMDGDGDLDPADVAVCSAVRAGFDMDRDHIAACGATQERGLLLPPSAAPAEGLRRPARSAVRRGTAWLPQSRKGNARARYATPGCAASPG